MQSSSRFISALPRVTRRCPANARERHQCTDARVAKLSATPARKTTAVLPARKYTSHGERRGQERERERGRTLKEGGSDKVSPVSRYVSFDVRRHPFRHASCPRLHVVHTSSLLSASFVFPPCTSHFLIAAHYRARCTLLLVGRSCRTRAKESPARRPSLFILRSSVVNRHRLSAR